MHVHHRLASCFAIGLNDVEPIRVKAFFNRLRDSEGGDAELLSRHLIELPNVGDMQARDDHRVAEGCGLGGEEGHRMFVSVHLASIWIITIDDLAERAALLPTDVTHEREYALSTQEVMFAAMSPYTAWLVDPEGV